MASQRGGARRSGTTQEIEEKYNKVEAKLKEEPTLDVQDVLKRYDLPVSTYYRLRAKHEASKIAGLPKQTKAQEVTHDELFSDIDSFKLFEQEKAKVAQNIADQRTSATAKRTITITFEFTPSESRDEIEVSYSAQSKLAPVKNSLSKIWCGKVGGEFKFMNQDPNQLSLFEANNGS